MDLLEFCENNKIQPFIKPSNTQIIQYLQTYKGILDLEMIIELKIENYKNRYIYIGPLTLYQRIYIYNEF